MNSIKIPFLLLMMVFGAFLSSIEVESFVDKTKIGIQDYLNYTIEISGTDLKDISPPDISRITDFRNMGTSTSSQESISIVNGRIEKTKTLSFIYRLKPRKLGNFVIPPIPVKYGSTNYVTSAVRIYVVKGTTEKLPKSRFDESDRQIQSDDVADNLFLEPVFRKKSIYEDEPLKIDYYLYTRYDVTNISFGEEPDFSGFWKEDVYLPQKISFNRATRDGVLFNRMLMRSIAIIPNQSGKVSIPRIELHVDIRTKSRSFFDFGESKRLTIRSLPREITVKELPETGKPSDYTGAVGNFAISSDISTDNLRVGDSFTYTLSIEGSGNLNFFEIPELPELRHLRFFEPEIISELNNDKISGKKIIKYLVVAQEKGRFEIPAVSFSFFDVKSGSYKTLRTNTYSINVAEGQSSFIPSGTAQSIVEMEGKDIGFIIRDVNLKPGLMLFSQPLYWLLWLISLVSIPFFRIYSTEKVKLEENLDYMRQKKAREILRKYMKKAARAVKNNNEDFYTAAQTGLTSYLADKMKINRGSSSAFILESLQKSRIPPETVSEIASFLKICDQARFMPGGFSSDSIGRDFSRLKEIISTLSRSKI